MWNYSCLSRETSEGGLWLFLNCSHSEGEVVSQKSKCKNVDNTPGKVTPSSINIWNQTRKKAKDMLLIMRHAYRYKNDKALSKPVLYVHLSTHTLLKKSNLLMSSQLCEKDWFDHIFWLPNTTVVVFPRLFKKKYGLKFLKIFKS